MAPKKPEASRVRLFIMDVDVRVALGGDAPKTLEGALSDDAALMLRALALQEGSCVDHQDLRTILKKSPTKDLYQIKGRLEILKRVSSVHGKGYKLDLADGDYLDAADLKTVVEKFCHLGDIGFEDVELPEASEALSELDRVLQLCKLNPALPIDSPKSRGPRKLGGLHAEYEDALEEARRARNVCRIALAWADSSRMSLARKAESELNRTLPEDRSDHDWYLLMGAHVAAGRPLRALAAYDDAVRCYESKRIPLSPRVHSLRERLSEDPTLGSKESPIASKEPLATTTDLLAVVQQLGITDATSMSLRGARMEPLDCIERTEQTLLFSGVLASKWVKEPHVRKELDDLLTRLDERTPIGDVRFLIINPVGAAYQKLRALRRGEISTSTLVGLRELMEAHPSFQVRVFDSLPAFRIIAIDDQVVTFSSYRLDADSYRETLGGRMAPHVVLDPTAPWPLAEAFLLYFHEGWDTAEPFENIDIAGLED